MSDLTEILFNNAEADRRELERLRAEHAEMAAERDELRAVKAAHDANVKMHGQAKAYHALLIAAEAERDRLQAEHAEMAALLRRWTTIGERDNVDALLVDTSLLLARFQGEAG